MTNSLLEHKLEYRYCAFLDILGFKDFLCQIETNDSQEKLYKLRSVLNFMNEETLDSAYGTDLPVWEVTDMKNILLLGVSRNWGGWLAAEAFEYLLGDPIIMQDNTLKVLLWKYQKEGSGFEGARNKSHTCLLSQYQPFSPHPNNTPL